MGNEGLLPKRPITSAFLWTVFNNSRLNQAVAEHRFLPFSLVFPRINRPLFSRKTWKTINNKPPRSVRFGKSPHLSHFPKVYSGPKIGQQVSIAERCNGQLHLPCEYVPGFRQQQLAARFGDEELPPRATPRC